MTNPHRLAGWIMLTVVLTWSALTIASLTLLSPMMFYATIMGYPPLDCLDIVTMSTTLLFTTVGGIIGALLVLFQKNPRIGYVIYGGSIIVMFMIRSGTFNEMLIGICT